MHPKVFVSHASEDKQRFVTGFATKLLENGVDAWLDKWEMLPGDSLVDKIFEEGLKEADAVIIVISENSVSKPWVKEELNASIVTRLQTGTRLIPVVIGDCEVPEALKSTVWESIPDLSNYGDSFDRILASIFGQSLKPRLGSPPAYTSEVLQKINGLEVIDNMILKKSCESLIDDPFHISEPHVLFGESSSKPIPKSEVLDSIEILEDESYISVSRHFGNGVDWGCHYRVTVFGFQEYCEAYVTDYGQTLDKCAGMIANKEARSNFELRDALDIPLMIANHVISYLEEQGYIKVSGEIGERISIYDVSAQLRRALR